MGFSLSEMWGHMGWPAITVAAVLLVMGLSSLTVFIERILTMRRSRAASAQFAAESGGHLREDMLETVIAEAEKYPDGHLPRVVKTALATYRHARDTADVSQLSPAERTARHRERYKAGSGSDPRRRPAARTGRARIGRVGGAVRRAARHGARHHLRVPGHRLDRIRRPVRRVLRHLRGTYRDRARPRRRHPLGARLQLPVHPGRAGRGGAEQRGGRGARQRGGLGRGAAARDRERAEGTTAWSRGVSVPARASSPT